MLSHIRLTSLLPAHVQAAHPGPRSAPPRRASRGPTASGEQGPRGPRRAPRTLTRGRRGVYAASLLAGRVVTGMREVRSGSAPRAASGSSAPRAPGARVRCVWMLPRACLTSLLPDYVKAAHPGPRSAPPRRASRGPTASGEQGPRGPTRPAHAHMRPPGCICCLTACLPRGYWHEGGPLGERTTSRKRARAPRAPGARVRCVWMLPRACLTSLLPGYVKAAHPGPRSAPPRRASRGPTASGEQGPRGPRRRPRTLTLGRRVYICCLTAYLPRGCWYEGGPPRVRTRETQAA